MDRSRRQDSILGVLNQQGRAAGTCFLAGPPGHVVTCAHVLADAGYGPGDAVTLRRGGDMMLPAHVLPTWSDRGDKDIACLELSDHGNSPVLEVSSAASVIVGARYETFGFPWLMRRRGMPGIIEVTGWTTEGTAEVIQGRSDEVSRGFSGAPVWDSDTGLVIGMVTSVIEAGRDPAGKQASSCYFRPVDVIRTVDPALALPDGEPFRGLQVFREADYQWYFGRDRAIASLLDLLESNDVVGLVGVSGSGKSSLLRAGLERGLGDREHAAVTRRRRIIFRPDRAPGVALRRALDLPDVDPAALAEAAQAASLREGTLLIVDQAEQLFTECESEVERAAFLDLLLAVSGDEIKVVVSLRADFFGAVLQHAAMAHAIDLAHMTLLPMDGDELRAAIVTPAARLGRAFERGLVDRIVADVRGRSGDLPLLQFALGELWRHDAQSGVLTTDSYERLGGVSGAVAVHADRVWADLSREERAAGTRVLVSLISIGASTLGTGLDLAVGRRASRREWGPLELQVAERLIAERLLAASQDPATREGLIGVSHEALLRAWGKARKWSVLHANYVRWYERQLEPFLRRWQDGDERGDLVLPSSLLADAESRLADAPELISEPARRYIVASARHREAEESRQAEEQDRLRRALSDAQRQRQAALARWLAADSASALEADPRLLPRSALLAVESLRRLRTLEGDRALRRALARMPRPLARFPMPHGAERVVVSGDGNVLAAVAGDGTVAVIRDPLHRKEIFLPELPGRALAVDLDSKGERLVVGGEGYILLISLETREEWRSEITDSAGAVAMSSDGRRFAVATGNSATVSDWAAFNRGTTVTHDDRIAHVALDASGRHVATACRDGIAAVWQVVPSVAMVWRHGRPREAVDESHFDPPAAVGLNENASVFVSGGHRGVARCVHTADGELLAQVDHGMLWAVNGVDATADGAVIATGSDDGTARIVATDTGLEAASACVSGNVKDVALTSDGARLATARYEAKSYEDGAFATWGDAVLWDTSPYTCVQECHAGRGASCCFDVDGRLWVATAESTILSLGDANPAPRSHSRRVLAMDAGPAGLTVADETGVSFDDAGASLRWGVPGIAMAAVSVSAKRAVGVQRIDGPTVYDAQRHLFVCALNSPEPLMSVAVEPVFHLTIARSGSRVAAASGSRHAVVWDVASREMIANFESNHIYAVALDAEGSRLGFTSFDTLIIRQLNDSGDERSLRHDGQFLRGLDLTPDGALAVTCSEEGHATVWDIPAGRELCRLVHDSPVRTVVIRPDGQFLASVTNDGTVRLWALDPAALIAETSVRVTRNLTEPEWRRYFEEEPYRPTIGILAWDELET